MKLQHTKFIRWVRSATRRGSVLRLLSLVPTYFKVQFERFKRLRLRYKLLTLAGLLLLGELFTLYLPMLQSNAYALGNGEGLLGESSKEMAAKLKFDQAKKQFNFNAEQSSQAGSIGGNPLASATAHVDPKKGVTVNDPINKTSFTLTPSFSLLDGRKDRDRIVYPLSNGAGWAVYTMQGTGVKEDIILDRFTKNSLSFSYELKLSGGMEAKLEADGSIGVYGNSLLSADISAGTEKDQKLLDTARKNAAKDTLLFTIPKPVVLDRDGPVSEIASRYALSGSTLTVTAENLDRGQYPLSIDPSIYVVTAQQFMAGNNETNINFDVANKLIKKGRTTGARFDAWQDTAPLPNTLWASGTAASGGYIYSVGGESFNGQSYTSQGPSTYVVPSGVTSISVKLWGAGGGGGGGGQSGTSGGTGGGGGYVTGTIPVTPGETLTVYVGGGGTGGIYNNGGNGAGGGGGGGGHTSIYRGSTLLALAAGGGGGGGARQGSAGGNAGAGGGVTGGTGASVGNGGGGTGGTASSGGGGGSGGNGNVGQAGGSLFGGNGADGRSNGSSTTGGGVSGGLASGGAGGQPNINTTRPGGGGGGSGWFGGGGGGSTTSQNGNAGGGGGGGSSRTDASLSGVTNTAGSGANPGNSGDSSRNGAGQGGTAGTGLNDGGTGVNGSLSITYGSSGSQVTSTVNWAKFNTGSGTIDSANPGTGACVGWCSTGAYSLPSARKNHSLVAYNGFLYVIGGTNASGARQSTVYVAKLGANGEPQLWHPTDSNKSNWVYWYQNADLPNIRALTGAVAYNNRIYLLGGVSTSAPINSVHIADVLPTGQLGSWTASTNLPTNLYAHDVQVYNDRLYVVGGAATIGGAPLSTVYYNKINTDGTLNAWVQTTSFNSGRLTQGGNMTVVWGAYIYISGGCRAVNTSGHCTTVASDSQVASINADGSIGAWNDMAGVTDTRMGHSLIAWRDNIYEIGGCSAQNTTNGDCSTSMLSTIKYGTINQDGDASTVGQSVPTTAAPCNNPTPTDCNLPGTTFIGNMLAGAVITNGHLYVIGGCTNNTCSTTTGNVAYVAISSTGQMVRPASCPGGTYRGNAWCVDTTNTVAGGIAATSPVVFGGRIYLVGGLDGGGNTNTIVRTSINPNGSISPWTSQSMTGVGATNVSYLYAFARANATAAATNPGNLYIFGGCTNSTSAGCTAYTGNVFKCNIQTSGAIQGCSTSGQLQIGVIPGGTNPGLAIMSGTVYAGYIYLIGGVSPDLQDLDTVRYAKIDNNNNIVTVGTGWVESPSTMNVGRRRAAAFGYNGYLYMVGGYEATSGVLPDIEFIKINVSDGSLIGDPSNNNQFFVSGVKINQRWGLSVPVSNSYAYVIGGCVEGASPGGCTSRTDVVQTFQIYNNDSGAPSGFSAAANTYATNPNRIGVSSTVLNGYLYAAGGCISGTDCTDATNNVSYAPLDSYGNVGTWSNTSAALPADRAWGSLRAAGGALYYMGGQSDTATDQRAEVYYASPTAGNVTSWQTAANGLPSPRSQFGATVWNNRLYVVGGQGTGTGCTAGVCNTVYVSPQLNSGGNISSAWSTGSTGFNVARSGGVAVAYANNLYLFGGYDGANYLSDSQFSQLNSTNGNAGAWSSSASMPQPLAQGDGFAANGYVYVMGGRSSATACDPITMVAPISANTTIASGNTPTGIGAWYETNQRFAGARYGNGVAYHDGKAYVVGGACSTPNEVSYTTTGTYSYTVPAGVTSLTIKAWGAGGGGGGGSTNGSGGAGGGGGYGTSTIAVTPGQSVSVVVGDGGNAGDFSSGGSGNNSGDGGGGGSFTRVQVNGVTVLTVGAGAGGGGGDNSSATPGGAGGAGGGTSGVNGGGSGSATGGTGGTATTGGTPGTGDSSGTAGGSLTGGNGSDGGATTTGAKNNGGSTDGGDGGNGDQGANGYGGGGGGGSGLFGGGGGGDSVAGNAGGGGGGGGSTAIVSGSGQSNIAGSGATPGNAGDTDRGTAGQGGSGGNGTNSGTNGSDGAVILRAAPSLAYNSAAVQQTTLLSQPQLAKYSIMIDTDSDVFPTNWLLNGLDNSIGARWQLRYRSMTNPTTFCTSPAMTTWGQETNFGNVTLGLPGVYIPLNGSGVSTNCARYYYFNVSVDSSQAFGYPDDVSRGPTITDLTLQFTADPSKRLLHGRTFTGGLQQPIDTPHYSQ